jgi:hypothetical protein
MLHLVKIMARAEEEARNTPFVAPHVPDAPVRTLVEGMVLELEPEPADFEGWGVYQARDDRAVLQREALIYEREEYLERFPKLRVHLVRRLEGRTWLAYPGNHSDMRQRIGQPRPLLVHLVDGGAPFDGAIVRVAGTVCLYDGPDRRADPVLARKMRRALGEPTPSDMLDIGGVTPEQWTAYDIEWRRIERALEQTAERRLERALEEAGGELLDVREGDAYWNVEWRAPDGTSRYSAIQKDDLTVVSAGLCLAGRDREFDIQSLVGVVDERPDWM